MVFRASRSFSRLIIWHMSLCIRLPMMNISAFSLLEIKASWALGKQPSSKTGSRMFRWLHTIRNLPSVGTSSRPRRSIFMPRMVKMAGI